LPRDFPESLAQPILGGLSEAASKISN
jgi:hypothetical protein